MRNYQTNKEKVLRISKRAYDEKLFAGTSGNLSIYDRDGGVIIITPSSLDYQAMQVDDIMVITPEGRIVEGKHAPSSEWRLHAAIYINCRCANAVVHTHSPFATSFAVSNEEIPLVLIEMVAFIGGHVPVAKFALPGTDQVGNEAIKVLQDRSACLMQNHGVVCFGDSLEQAHTRSVYVEDAAKIYHYAKLNGNARPIADEHVKAMFERRRAGE